MTLLPEFRAQLHTVAHRRAHSRRRRFAHRFSIDGRLGRAATTIPVLLSVLLTVAIAIVAIATLGHHHKPTGASSPPASSRNELLRTIGVLRRPQTKADVHSALPRGEGGEFPGLLGFSGSPVCRSGNHPPPPCALKLDRSLVRTVKAGGGYQVALFPTVVARSIAGAPRGEGVVMALRGPGIYLATSGLKPASPQAIRARGLLLSAYVANGINRGVILVPDGVAKVTLDHFRLVGPTAASLSQIAPTSSTVSDNVALFQLAGLTPENLHLSGPAAVRLHRYFYQGSGRGCQVSFAVYGLPATAHMTWLDAAGDTIHRAPISFLLYVGTRQPPAGTTTVNPDCAQRTR